MSLKNKCILITAGPTWVPIDSVRIISNIATGETGLMLAEKLCSKGARVTLLLGPGEFCCLSNSKVRLIRFRFFNELHSIFARELRARKYDAVIHSAAVSDYRPLRYFREKIKSGLKKLEIELFPAPKIIDSIKKISPDTFLVGFKFEPDAGKKILIKRAKRLFSRAGLDLVVANSAKGKKYRAYIINRENTYGPLQSKNVLSERLVKIIGENL